MPAAPIVIAERPVDIHRGGLVQFVWLCTGLPICTYAYRWIPDALCSSRSFLSLTPSRTIVLARRDPSPMGIANPIAQQKGTYTGLWAQQSDPEHLSRFTVSIGRRSIGACNRPQNATGESLRREARWASGKPCPGSPRQRAWRRPGALRRKVARRAATLSEVHRDRGRRVAIPPAGQSD